MDERQLRMDVARIALAKLKAFDAEGFLRQVETDFNLQFGEESMSEEAGRILLATFSLSKFLDSDTGRLMRIAMQDEVIIMSQEIGIRSFGLGSIGIACWDETRWGDVSGDINKASFYDLGLVQVVADLAESLGGSDRLLIPILKTVCGVIERVAQGEHKVTRKP